MNTQERTFVFVTGSADKLREAERILAMTLERMDAELPEIQAVEVEQVISAKARAAYTATGNRPVMVEDTGLSIGAWNGLPGALVKWFIERVGARGICEMLTPAHDRSAVAETIVATFEGNSDLHLFAARVSGRIAETPKGTRGFGWDSIFIPDGSARTFAEMSASEKDTYSMRRMALESMRAYYATDAGKADR